MAGQTFLGSGWDIGCTLEGTEVKMAHHEESIRQSIVMILNTSPGERLMRPEFGSNLQDLVFSVNNAGLAGAAADAVQTALTRWEPRITVLDVDAYEVNGKPNVLHINISYQIVATNSRRNFVYPFYLDQI